MQTLPDRLDIDLAALERQKSRLDAALERQKSRLDAALERLAYAVDAEHSKLLRTRDGLDSLIESLAEDQSFSIIARAAGIFPGTDGAWPLSRILAITRRRTNQLCMLAESDRTLWQYLDAAAEDLAHERCGVAPRRVSEIARQWLADRTAKESSKGRAA